MKPAFPTKALTSVAALSLALATAGCSASGTSTVSDVISSAGTSSQAATTSGTTTASDATADTSSVSADEVTEDTHFDADDLDWDQDAETTISLADAGSTVDGQDSDAVSIDGGTITISAAGDYRISGSLTDGRIVVTAGEDEVVRLILDGAQIANGTGPALQMNEANEVLLYLAEGSSNALSDGSDYADTSEDAANAAVYSKADLTIAGPGTLEVRGNYADGIVSKDGLVLASGTVSVTAADDGIKGKDYVALLGGNYTVTAAGDGIKSTNDTDEGRGWLHQYAGVLSVSSGDDAIKAEREVTISGGSATVTESVEGIEAAAINLSGGTIDVTSSDDGLNASVGSSTDTTTGGGGGMDAVQDATINISGGQITVTADGDGIDSNGDVTISGGTTVVNGPTNGGNGALDSNGDFTVTGGVLLAAGSDGMAEGLSDSSTQSGVQASLGTIAAGTAIQVVDADGTVLTTFVTTRETQNVVYTSPEISDGQTYSFYTGGTADVDAGLGAGTLEGATEVTTATADEYSSGMGGGMGGGQPGGIAGNQ